MIEKYSPVKLKITVIGRLITYGRAQFSQGSDFSDLSSLKVISQIG